ncbi:3,4-dihydroxy-2-butanone-4-phosphate synthase [Aquitalea sp.]|uniref:3,4-dihydroxy-2-butanone-4-phosphate synthase n=1 Tax=Aquitalea sp. TaxID=1872623 RepID=UPI00258594E7|nr:3,4-dihydroxy-2-butanone-4-phosphate synthase [Aquitalea sp.]
MSYPHSTHLPSRLATALAALRQGLPVIVSDDDDRENEADLIMAADNISQPEMARMIRDGSGIVCLCLTSEHAARLQLAPMVQDNGSRYGTAFTVSIEATQGVSTGVSAADRVTTIRAAIAPHAKPQDLARPGHVFPLIARPGGVLERRGHTEAAVELATLAGFSPAGVLCELMNPDGRMMRGEQLTHYAAHHGLPMLTVAELADWRCQQQAEPQAAVCA